jgi:hypothetical protein
MGKVSGDMMSNSSPQPSPKERVPEWVNNLLDNIIFYVIEDEYVPHSFSKERV